MARHSRRCGSNWSACNEGGQRRADRDADGAGRSILAGSRSPPRGGGWGDAVRAGQHLDVQPTRFTTGTAGPDAGYAFVDSFSSSAHHRAAGVTRLHVTVIGAGRAGGSSSGGSVGAAAGRRARGSVAERHAAGRRSRNGRNARVAVGGAPATPAGPAASARIARHRWVRRQWRRCSASARGWRHQRRQHRFNGSMARTRCPAWRARRRRRPGGGKGSSTAQRPQRADLRRRRRRCVRRRLQRRQRRRRHRDRGW